MEHQGETGLPLDGNAAAGLLSELFALDVTVAEVNAAAAAASPRSARRESTVGSWERYFAALTATALSCD